MELIKNKDNKIVFSAELSNSFINAIRRQVHEVPVLAVDEVEIAKNDSALHDETLAHRIGLVPLKNNENAKEMDLKTSKEGYVYSGELKGDSEVVFEKMPLTLLQQNQDIDLKAYLRLGKGREHSKFVPGLVFFREEREITLPKEHKETIQKQFPESEIKESGQKITVKDSGEKDIGDFVEGLADRSGHETQSKNTGNIVVSIESFGQMKPSEIFEKAIQSLKGDIETISKTVK